MTADGRENGAPPDRPRKPARQQATNNDAELVRSFVIGCVILLVLFVIGSGIITWFWLR